MRILFSVRTTKETRLMVDITGDFAKQSNLEKIRFENSHLMGVFERDFHDKTILLRTRVLNANFEPNSDHGADSFGKS